MNNKYREEKKKLDEKILKELLCWEKIELIYLIMDRVEIAEKELETWTKNRKGRKQR